MNTFTWNVDQWSTKQETKSPKFLLTDCSMKFTLKLSVMDNVKGSVGENLVELSMHVGKFKQFVFGYFFITMDEVAIPFFYFYDMPSGDYPIFAFDQALFENPKRGLSCKIVWVKNERWESVQRTLIAMDESSNKLQQDGCFSDLVIATQDGSRFPVHKCILAMKSPVFLSVLQNGTCEARNNLIEINDISSDTVKNMIKYFYTGSLHAPSYELAAELLQAAEKYDIIGLKDLCVQQLLRYLNCYNALHLLLMMDRYRENNSKEAVLQYISRHRREFSQRGTFDCLRDNPDLLAEVLHTVLSV